MNVAAPIMLRPENFPDADPSLLEAINRALLAQRDTLMAALTSSAQVRFKEDLRFRTGGGGTAYLDVAADPPPKHAWVTRLEADKGALRLAEENTGAEVTAPYSATWVRIGLDGRRGVLGLRFLFTGLSADTPYVCSVALASGASGSQRGKPGPLRRGAARERPGDELGVEFKRTLRKPV